VTVRGLLVKDLDGEPFISWDEAYVNFQLSSFFGDAWAFKEISLAQPYVRVQMNKDKTFNFSDITRKFSTNAPASAKKEPSKPVQLHVGRLHIGGAEIALTDFTPSEPFKRLVGPFDIALDNFRTESDNKNPYSFVGTTDAGETISWGGFFYLTPLRSEGEVQLHNFELNKYAPLYQDFLRFQIHSGSIALDLKYHVEFSPTNQINTVHDMAWALRDLKIGMPGDTNDIFEVPLFTITGANADLQHRTATIDDVILQGARAWLNRNTNEAVNVVEMSRPAPTITNAPGSGIIFLLRSVTNAVAMLLNSTNQWSGTVRNITATNCELHLIDLANQHPARLDLSDIALSAKNLSNLPGTNLEADFSLRWNTNGSIHINAGVGFQPTMADIDLDFSHLDLTTLDAYLASKVRLYILGSDVNLHGTVRLRPDVNNLPVVSFNGDSSLENFHTVDGAFGQDLVSWNALSFNSIAANLNPPLVAVDQIVLDKVDTLLIIETNHTINLENVLKPAGNSPPQTNEMKVAATPKPETAKTEATNTPIQISVNTILLTNSTIHFVDRSIQPNVNLDLQSVNGTISDLGSEKMQHAVINLSSKVGGSGPLTITGTINPLNNDKTNSLSLKGQNIDLTALSPYVAKFAGYDLAEGKLNLALEYQLVGTNLAAKNGVVLDQFTFGDKVDSTNATHLPVKLAVALLKDSEGKIVIDVPVEGSLGDPKFHIGKEVTRVVVSILEKAATSPFSLLGAAFGGGGEELGWQEFAVGSSGLTDASKKKLDTMAKALAARPALKLELVGSIDPEGDREGLQRQALDQQIRERYWSKLRRSEQAKSSAAQVVLTPEIRAHYIEKLENEAFKAGKITPELIAANTNLAAYAAEAAASHPQLNRAKGGELLRSRAPASAAAAGKSANVAVPFSKLKPPPSPAEALLLATMPVGDDDLRALANARARAVEAYLLEVGKVDAARLFLTSGSAAGLRRNGSRVYLELR
jgi:hypothetical protein